MCLFVNESLGSISGRSPARVASSCHEKRRGSTDSPHSSRSTIRILKSAVIATSTQSEDMRTINHPETVFLANNVCKLVFEKSPDHFLHFLHALSQKRVRLGNVPLRNPFRVKRARRRADRRHSRRLQSIETRTFWRNPGTSGGQAPVGSFGWPCGVISSRAAWDIRSTSNAIFLEALRRRNMSCGLRHARELFGDIQAASSTRHKDLESVLLGHSNSVSRKHDHLAR